MSNWPGIYRGTVTNNVDPNGKSAIKLFIPQVLGPGVESNWALPCLPPGWGAGLGTVTVHDTYTGGGSGVLTLDNPVPAIGAGIWVMFEGGDKEHPVWLGGWI